MWQESLEQHGFAILPAVLGPQETSQVLCRVTSAASTRSRAGVRHALHLKPVADLACDARLLELARTVLGSEAFPFRATLFDKSLTSNWLVVWHQDTALPLQIRRELPGWGPWSVKDG